MKRYLRNLLSALLFTNPFQKELEDLTAKCNKATDDVRGLNELYYKAIGKWEESENKFRDTVSDLDRCRNLIEILRSRIAEKDEMIARLQAELNSKQ